MTSQRWSTLVSVLVFALVLATAGSARAQWGFPGISGSSRGQPVRPGLRGCPGNLAFRLRLIRSGEATGARATSSASRSPAMRRSIGQSAA